MSFAPGDRAGDDLLSPQSSASLAYLRRQVHVEWIALNPSAHQAAVDDPGLVFGDDPPDGHLVHAIRQAHRLGLGVMLKPHIQLREQSDLHWRGTIAMRTEADWRAWFASYERFLLHYARIAAREDVEILCVGVELALSAREREADWRLLIDRVRTVYDGPLTYAANWWGEYDAIGFWDALDYIGINAFFPLGEGPSPSLTDLRAGAGRVADEVELVHLATRKPVLFTEVGYKSIPGAGTRPWEWPRRVAPAVDVDLQSRCYQAVLETFWGRPWFCGMYWWRWYADLDQGGLLDGDFTPRRKPAEGLLTEWYRRPRHVDVR